MTRLFFTISLITAMSPSTFLQGDEPSNVQKPAQLNTQVKVKMDYLLYLPKEYDKQKSWPLLLFLHGSGERGDDLELVKKHGPPKLISQGKDLPFIVVSPQCRKDRRWEPIELVALLDEIIRTHNVDEDRIYVTGLRWLWDMAAGHICTGKDCGHRSNLRRRREVLGETIRSFACVGIPWGQG